MPLKLLEAHPLVANGAEALYSFPGDTITANHHLEILPFKTA